jgi:cysteine synthase A
MPTSRLGLIGLGLGVGVGGGLLLEKRQRHTTALCNSSSSSSSVVDSVGNTPLLEIKSLSAATGCRILAKAEYMNPGGSIKDRAALWLIREAERTGQLRKGGTICEGTGGNTGIGLAMLANAMGYRCIFAMGRGIAKEKIEMMRTFGAEVILTPPVPFDSPEHYFHRAAAAAAAGNAREPASHFFTNQFENTASSLAHFESTGPEIWQQVRPASAAVNPNLRSVFSSLW